MKNAELNLEILKLASRIVENNVHSGVPKSGNGLIDIDEVLKIANRLKIFAGTIID